LSLGRVSESHEETFTTGLSDKRKMWGKKEVVHFQESKPGPLVLAVSALNMSHNNPQLPIHTIY